MIPLKINSKNLCEIFTPDVDITNMTDEEIQNYSISSQMYPTSVAVTSETYSRDANRTANYELENFSVVNRKAKAEFSWSLIKKDYVEKLMAFLQYDYNFKNADGDIVARDATTFSITYQDFVGQRTMLTYLGQTIDGTLVEYEGVQYWENFRIAFPER